MLRRIFGREKNDPNHAACASCGRTLLAGEWTQTVIDDKGREQRVCSLCTKPSPSHERGDALEPTGNDTRRQSKPEDSAESARSKSDAFWRALKDKNAEIEWYQAQLARLEAERQEMLGRLSQISAAAEDTRHEDPAEPAAELKPTPDEDEPAVDDALADAGVSATAVEDALANAGVSATAVEDVLADAGMSAAAVDSEATAMSQEDTQPIPVISVEEAADLSEAVPAPEESVSPEFAAPAPVPEEYVAPEFAAPPPVEESVSPEFAPPAPVPEEYVAPEFAAPAPHEDAADAADDVAAQLTAAEIEAQARAQAEADARAQAEAEAEAASLKLLQRGVDLLNVSTVPRKIAETNEQLGMPTVHVAYDDQTLVVTFMWSIGWYRFHVDTESGQVSMNDRGYDELTSLLPNAGVRADGTVQLAAGQLSRPSAPPHAETEAEAEAEVEADKAEEPAAPEPSGPEPPSATSEKAPEILSKSLLGQRSDDEPATWEETQAREFKWD